MKFKDAQRQKLYEQCLEKLNNGLGNKLSELNCWRGNFVNQMIWEGIHWAKISQRFPNKKPDTNAYFYACFAAGRDWAKTNKKETP